MKERIGKIVVGDCVEVMRRMKESSVDAIVTDPPYGLEFMGKQWDTFGKPSGFDKRTRTNSGQVKDAYARTLDRAPVQYVAGKAFQEWCEVWAREALRVLKPGGYLLAFGGTRTSHRLACAIEDAGFTLRDTLMWMYGSGFPKSLDVSKALDKHLGAEPTRTGKRRSAGGTQVHKNGSDKQHEGWARPWMDAPPDEQNTLWETTPTTDEAKRYAGFGTALKPAWEPIVLARKPLIGTVAENVLQHGTGGLNIDGTRIAGEKPVVKPIASSKRNNPILHTKSASPTGETTTEGRWPANVALTHDPACAFVSTKTIIGETIDTWTCAQDCPVRLLDEQSGERPSRARASKGAEPEDGATYGGGWSSRSQVNYGDDTGGASRFFYTAKAQASERHARGRVENKHPTVKPVDLMQWLIRLVTPPNGIVLDPFCGSGSTLVAARKEGFRFIGIDKDADSIETATERVGLR